MSEELVARIRAAGEAFAVFLGGVSEASFRATPGGDEWSIAELAGHAAEFPVTFAGQCARLAASPGLALGRQLDDPGRLAALRQMEGAGPAEAAARVRAATGRTAMTLDAIPPAGWDAAGTRVVNGEPITVRLVVERFIAGHLEGHLQQARDTLAKVTARP